MGRELMGLLEKAGKIKDDEKPKKATKKDTPKAAKAKPKPAKAAKAKPKAAKASKVKSKGSDKSNAKEAKQRKPRVAREMPDDFQLAGRASRGARGLVDFIVTYAGILALLGYTAIGSNFNPTLILLGALIPLTLNMIFLPMKTNRTVGMFLTRSRYVNSKGNYPHWTHLFLSNLTGLFVMAGLALLLMGGGSISDPLTKKAGTQMLIFGGLVLLIPLADYIVTKLRKAAGQSQNMYDAIYGCWYVVAERAETEGGNRWMARLESLGDWGEKKGWSGSADDEDEESDD